MLNDALEQYDEIQRQLSELKSMVSGNFDYKRMMDKVIRLAEKHPISTAELLSSFISATIDKLGKGGTLINGSILYEWDEYEIRYKLGQHSKLEYIDINAIEKALGFKLYDNQLKYLRSECGYWYGGRATGKTLAYCIKLALTEGEPLDMREPQKYCDADYGMRYNKVKYAKGHFYREFIYVHSKLKAAGLPVRELRY